MFRVGLAKPPGRRSYMRGIRDLIVKSESHGLRGVARIHIASCIFKPHPELVDSSTWNFDQRGIPRVIEGYAVA